MIDLQLCENKSKRIEFWQIFEKIADEHIFLYDYLSVVKKTPEKYTCELCFLFYLLSEEITQKLQRKLSFTEASVMVSIYWGAMERKDTCNCGIVAIMNSMNEITRENMEY